MRRFQVFPFAGLLSMAAASLIGCQAQDHGAVYSVKEYNPTRDPAADLAATVEQAEAGGKRILLQVGGEWCGWCHKLDNYIATHPTVAESLRDHFVIMKVNYSDENENAEFISQFPEVPGYPHLYVLESDGTFLHSQPTAELEEGSSYSEPALLEFIANWSGQSSLVALN